MMASNYKRCIAFNFFGRCFGVFYLGSFIYISTL